MSFEYTEVQTESMKKIADYHLGHIEDQYLQAIQEFAELQVEITKWNLGKANYTDLIDELFDADFMILQLKMILIRRPQDLIFWNKKVNEKIERELVRHDLK